MIPKPKEPTSVERRGSRPLEGLRLPHRAPFETGEWKAMQSFWCAHTHSHTHKHTCTLAHTCEHTLRFPNWFLKPKCFAVEKDLAILIRKTNEMPFAELVTQWPRWQGPLSRNKAEDKWDFSNIHFTHCSQVSGCTDSIYQGVAQRLQGSLNCNFGLLAMR